jgi:hypothetical protein
MEIKHPPFSMKDKFLNFPVQLLQDAFKDIRQTMVNVLDYAGYAHTLKLEHGSIEKKMEDAGSYFGITWGNTLKSYRSGETLYESIPENSPMAGINKDVCFDFYKNHKTPDEIAVLLAFLAIKSIIGTKPYCRITNAYLIARMAGYAKIEDMPHPLPEPLAQYHHNKHRRKLDKIKKELQLNWNVNIYGTHTRGYYVSIDKKFDMNKLAFEAEKRRKSTKEKELKQRNDEARRLALEKLKPLVSPL